VATVVRDPPDRLEQAHGVTSRSTTWRTGAVVLIVYLLGALVSGRLSPIARRPLLDGLAPLAPYRWVNPPADLADTNQPPTPGRVSLPVRAEGVRGAAVATPDAQVTVIVPDDAIPAAAGQDSVTLTIQPLDPATLGPVRRSLVVLGNAVRIAATYEPSGATVRKLIKPIEVVLTYPFVPEDGGERTLLESTNGQDWSRVRTTDHVGPSQAIGKVTSFGYVLVAGRRLKNVPGQPSTGTGERVPLIILGFGALLVLLILVLIFGGRSERPRRGDRG
jgi:hypothetical protein